MLASYFIEISDRAQFDKLAELSSHLTSDQLESDFKQGFFTGYLIYDSSDRVLSYVILTKGYSTWQHRMLYISDLWFNPTLNQDEICTILASTRDFLFTKLRKLDVMRLQINLEFTEENEFLKNWFLTDKAVNLTVQEGWHVLELNEHSMLKFMDLKTKYNESEFRMAKVQEMNLYANAIRDLIRELAEFESMVDQVDTRSDKLVRDYANDENKFYDSVVVLDNRTQELVGYALYFLSYDLKRGRGCYMEDLYIKEKFRKQGLGIALWREVIADCVQNYKTCSMRWSVLDWNKSAIEFYYKFGSVDLTVLNKLNFVRYTTDRIYS
jgi:ribosomal protein S18 acetylase RimI-like enzyme